MAPAKRIFASIISIAAMPLFAGPALAVNQELIDRAIDYASDVGTHPTSPERCENYATSAVSYAKKVQELHCGMGADSIPLNEPRWSTDYEAHKNWCLATNTREINIEQEIRRNLASRCETCNDYAQKAMAQIEQAGRCNFSGPRWSPDFAVHLNWCQNLSIWSFNSTRAEQYARDAELEQCKASLQPQTQAQKVALLLRPGAGPMQRMPARLRWHDLGLRGMAPAGLCGAL